MLAAAPNCATRALYEHRQNVVMQPHKGKVCMVTTRATPAGGELLTCWEWEGQPPMAAADAGALGGTLNSGDERCSRSAGLQQRSGAAPQGVRPACGDAAPATPALL